MLSIRIMLLAICTAVPALACSGDSPGGTQDPLPDTLRPPQGSLPGRVIDGVRYHIRASTNERSTPMAVIVDVEAHMEDDRGPAPLRGLASPALELRLYTAADRTGPPVWSSVRSAAGTCRETFPGVGEPAEPTSAASVRSTTPPSVPGDPIGPVAIECSYSGPQILGDSLPDARYHYAVALRFVGDTLEFPAGEGWVTNDTLPPLVGRDAMRRSLRYDVTARVLDDPSPRLPAQGDELELTATITNTGNRRVRVHYGCAVRNVRVYPATDRAGTHLWLGPPYGCDDIGNILVVAPGQAESRPYMSLRIPTDQILGDSLQPGRYHFSVDVHVGSPSAAVAEGAAALEFETFRVDAGSAVLRARR